MKISSTITGTKEEFIVRDNTVNMYVCGVTPYDDCHFGHAMSYIIFDTIRRYLEYRGFKVNYVQNFTDIDDKIINRANERGVSAQALSSQYIDSFFSDMDALNIKRADIYPRVTGEIPKIIEVVDTLIKKGHAYEGSGSVYFKVSTFPGYGKLSGQKTDEMMPKATSEEGKEHPLDFALWKAAKPGEPYWESPWGKGRPGWHIECTAMSLKYLPGGLDIHGGGQDLIFPHHENEIAQSECYTGVTPFARYWLHNGLLQMGKEKMSKSLGNLVKIKEALQTYSPDGIRLFVLSSYYRNPLDFSDEALKAAEKGAERLRLAAGVEGTEKNGKADSIPYREKFIATMDDDFNTAQAVAVLFDLARAVNRGQEEGQDVSELTDTLKGLASVLGFTLKEKTKAGLTPQGLKELVEEITFELLQSGNLSSEVNSLMMNVRKGEDVDLIISGLISLRNDFRKEKRWKLADLVRDKMAAASIILEDSSSGTTWKLTG